ncbi:MAG TPA: hypothetical protein VK961_01655 [Chthoniobacter sp.]|nr:hypothetical protein [Chthoniobacter sp.]
MSSPIIDPESGMLIYPQWLTWEHQFAATNSPYDWSVASGGFPTGMTFQPTLTGVTGDYGTDVFTKTAHGLSDGMAVVFRAKTGGTGLATNTVYYVINAATDTFQLTSTPGGTVLDFTTSNVSAGTLYRPGLLTGYATLPGISDVRLIATNTGPTNSAEQLFTIGITAAAVVPDANCDLVWDFAANNIIAQDSSALNLTPAPRDTPILYVKENDDLIIRLRLVKGASVLDLGAIDDDNCKLVLKELEPDGKIIVSDASRKIGTGDANSILIHAKITGGQIKAAFANYEADGGTLFASLAEIELTYPNPGYFEGTPADLVRTSRTFRIQTERDLGED